MLMSGIRNPRLGIGPLIRVSTNVSVVMFSSRKRSDWPEWLGRQMALKPWPFHVPSRPARAPSGSGAAASDWISSVGCTSGVASPANAKSGSVCVPAVIMTSSRISRHFCHRAILTSLPLFQRLASTSLIHRQLLLLPQRFKVPAEKDRTALAEVTGGGDPLRTWQPRCLSGMGECDGHRLAHWKGLGV